MTIYYLDHFRGVKELQEAQQVENEIYKDEFIETGDYCFENIPSLFYLDTSANTEKLIPEEKESQDNIVQISDFKDRTVPLNSSMVRYPSARVPCTSVMVNMACDEDSFEYIIDTHLNLYPHKNIVNDLGQKWPEFFEYGYIGKPPVPREYV